MYWEKFSRNSNGTGGSVNDRNVAAKFFCTLSVSMLNKFQGGLIKVGYQQIKEGLLFYSWSNFIQKKLFHIFSCSCWHGENPIQGNKLCTEDEESTSISLITPGYFFINAFVEALVTDSSLWCNNSSLWWSFGPSNQIFSKAVVVLP